MVDQIYIAIHSFLCVFESYSFGPYILLQPALICASLPALKQRLTAVENGQTLIKCPGFRMAGLLAFRMGDLRFRFCGQPFRICGCELTRFSRVVSCLGFFRKSNMVVSQKRETPI